MGPRRHTGEDGFTIIEVMVAAAVLLVGILGVVMTVDTANSTTTSNKAREQGLSLARELVESARSVRYQSLRPATVVPALQGMSGFANAGAGTGWTIKRRGIVYTVSVGVCSVDDPADGTGAHAANSFCTRAVVQANAATCKNLIGTPPKINGTGGTPGADGGDCGIDSNLDGQVDGLVQSAASDCPTGTSVTAGTCDAQPDDFKRLVTLVTWDRGGGSRYVIQQATVPFPGLAAYGDITSVSLGGYTAGSNGYAVNDKPNSLTFTATSDQAANRADWLRDGVDQGQISGWSGASGSFTWTIGDAPDNETTPGADEVVDGTYVIGARVQDDAGIHGNELDVAVRLNRRAPFPPTGFFLTGAGTSTVTGAWNAPPDQDIVGYRMYRKSGGVTKDICGVTTALSCSDTSPPPGNGVTSEYWVVAVDTNSSGALRDGQQSASQTTTQSSANQPPTAPATLTAVACPAGTNCHGNNRVVKLDWAASTDSDTGMQNYAIYRSLDGVSYSFLTYSAGTAITYNDPSVNKNTKYWYRVTGFDLAGLEGPPSPVASVTP